MAWVGQSEERAGMRRGGGVAQQKGRGECGEQLDNVGEHHLAARDLPQECSVR